MHNMTLYMYNMKIFCSLHDGQEKVMHLLAFAIMETLSFPIPVALYSHSRRIVFPFPSHCIPIPVALHSHSRRIAFPFPSHCIPVSAAFWQPPSAVFNQCRAQFCTICTSVCIAKYTHEWYRKCTANWYIVVCAAGTPGVVHHNEAKVRTTCHATQNIS